MNPEAPDPSADGCSINYEITSDWGSGFNAGLVVTNHEPTTVSGWTLSWSFNSGQRINSLWEGEVTQTDATVTVQNAAWNGTIAPDGGIVSLGFGASGDGSAIPDKFSLNGTSCNLSQREFSETSPTPAATAMPTATPTATPTVTPSGGQPTTTLPDPINPEEPSGIAVYLPLFVP